jgi:hypothetical protein
MRRLLATIGALLFPAVTLAVTPDPADADQSFTDLGTTAVRGVSPDGGMVVGSATIVNEPARLNLNSNRASAVLCALELQSCL